MLDIKHYTVILIAAFLAAIACAALFFSYTAYRSSTEVGKNFRQAFEQLTREVSSLKTQLAAQGGRAEADSTQPASTPENTAASISKEKPLATQIGRASCRERVFRAV